MKKYGCDAYFVLLKNNISNAFFRFSYFELNAIAADALYPEMNKGFTVFHEMIQFWVENGLKSIHRGFNLCFSSKMNKSAYSNIILGALG